MANLIFKRIKDWATSITSFRTGDVIPVDGPSGTAKMSKDDLLAKTAENTLSSIDAEIEETADESDDVKFVDDSNNLIVGISQDGVDIGGCGKITKDSNYAYDDEVVLCNDKNDPYVKFGEYGAKVKGIFFIDGETIIRRITVGPNGQMFTSLTEAVLEAVKVPSTEVIVKNGTYDIIQEFENLYGADFFSNYNEDSGGKVGIKLYNGIKLFFDSRAFVTCNYTGNNSKVMDVFSPFNANPMVSNNDFEIHGLKIKASNVRYAVHDDMWSNATPYTHRYLDCDMYIDNTKSVPNPDNPSFRFVVCIGGGLGKYGKILLEGCKFETEEYKESSTTGPGVSWHNSSAAGAKSVLDVNGCYFAGGSTFKFTWYGASEEMSTAYVRGCRIGSPLINQAENGSATIVNASIIAWNNEEI